MYINLIGWLIMTIDLMALVITDNYQEFGIQFYL